MAAAPGATVRNNAVIRLRRHPLILFFVLAFGATWAIWIPRAAGVPVGIIGELSTWTVAVMAVLAAALTGGRAALRDLGGRLVRWRMDWRWYALVLVGPAAFALTTAGVYVVLGGSWSDAAPRFLTGNLTLLPLLVLTVALTDGLGEELGWRGFALPRLLARHSPWLASVLLGLLWATWHLPLLWTEGRTLYGQPFWLLLLDLGAKAVIFTWVFLRTRGSVLLAVLLHATNNVFAVSPVVSVTGTLTLPLIAVSLEWVLAALVLIGSRPTFARRVYDPEGRFTWPRAPSPAQHETSRPTIGSEPGHPLQ